MQIFYAACLNNLLELHIDMEKALEGLPPAALDWSPKQGVNSITALIVHTAGAERFLFGEIIAGVPATRDRDAEFRARDLSPNELTKVLADSRTYVASVLETLTPADLEAKRAFRAREVTVGWVIGHALKHTATHLGNIQIMRDMWEQFKM
jgi:uncharacterized damage-inducible protein DinB